MQKLGVFWDPGFRTKKNLQKFYEANWQTNCSGVNYQISKISVKIEIQKISGN